ncbi:MAG TPA: hypothetical protein VHQ21_05065, partial [Rhodanobacteraceae bacterium]|nr:hypothetical protein [Rhodanobacteraceae bacterium]
IQYFGAAITGPANRVTQPRAAAEYCARRGLDMQEGVFWTRYVSAGARRLHLRDRAETGLCLSWNFRSR